MPTNVPTYILSEIRLSILDSTSFSDNDVYTFLRQAIKASGNYLDVGVSIIDGTSVYDYTVSKVDGTISTELWEVYKWAATAAILDKRLKDFISEGVGVSYSVGSEHIDTKSLIITLKELVKEAKQKHMEALGAYNLRNVQGSVLDLYRRDWEW